MYSELEFTQKRLCHASPPPALPSFPPQNDLDQSYSASTSSSVLQLFSSPLSINLPPSPPLHAVDSISPPKFATEACSICTNRGPIVSWKNACRRWGMTRLILEREILLLPLLLLFFIHLCICLFIHLAECMTRVILERDTIFYYYYYCYLFIHSFMPSCI